MKHPPIQSQIIFLYTNDLVSSAEFYENILGLSLWLDQGSCRIYRTSQDAYLGICQTGDKSKGTFDEGEQRNVILTLVTENVDDWYTFLSERGILFEQPPHLNEHYKIYHCFLRDPNGYLIEIQRFL